MRSLFLPILILPILLSASTIVNYEVLTHSDRVDVMISFDQPYSGEVRKSRAEDEIMLIFDDASITTPKLRDVSSPFLSRFVLTPLDNTTKFIADVATDVTLHTSKSGDSRTLQLRFVGPKGLKAVEPVKKAAPELLQDDEVEKSGDPAPAALLKIGTVVAIILLVGGWIVVRRRKDKNSDTVKSGSQTTLSGYIAALKSRFPALTRSSGSGDSRNKKELSRSKYLKAFNPKNKLMTLLAGLVIIALLVPKINLYYQLEHLIKPYGVILSGEEMEDKRLWLSIKDGVLFYQQIESAKIETIDVMLFVLYDRIRAENIRLSSTLEGFLPPDIEHITLRYSVLDPLRVTLEGVGDFGELSGELLLRERSVKVTLKPSLLMTKRFASTLKTLKRDNTGGYYYESRF